MEKRAFAGKSGTAFFARDTYRHLYKICKLREVLFCFIYMDRTLVLNMLLDKYRFGYTFSAFLHFNKPFSACILSGSVYYMSAISFHRLQ